MLSLNGDDATPMKVLKMNDQENSEISSNDISLTESFSRRHRSYNRWSPIDEGLTLAWRDVSIYAKPKKGSNFKQIINNVSGAVKAGSLVALMGSSGAGKSTLMSALALRNSGDVQVDGDILINGRQLGPYIKYLSGFMHQDDLFVGSLTVLEHMNLMAHLKLDRRISPQKMRLKILYLLNELGLSKCIHTRIGSESEGKSLSGGERKRLAFASELLTDPPILFCDEPTTGLDSYSTQKLISMMNKMTATGKTIICTIHQPSSDIFTMFSQIILLAEGRIAFIGSSASALEFFERLDYVCPKNYNPAEFFIQTLSITPGLEDNCKQIIKKICDNFITSDYAKEVDIVVQYEFHMGRAETIKEFSLKGNFKEIYWWSKLKWLTYRWLLEILRKPSVQFYKILQKIGIALMVGLCYLGTDLYTQNGIQSVQGAIFMFVTENAFFPMYSVLAEFPQYMPLFLREHKSGLYNSFTYYVSRILAMLPRFIIEPVCFSIIVYWLAGLRNTMYAFFMTTLISTVTMNVSAACGIFFSNCFESAPLSMAYLIPFDFTLLVTSGLFIKLNTLSNVLAWTKYLSWIMYSTECISIVQWSGITNITCEIDDKDLPCIMDGNGALEKYSFSEDNFSRDMFVMLILMIVFYVVGYFCLWQRARKQ